MIWDIDPVLLQLDWLSTPVTNGPLQIRFYGVFFAIGLLGAAWAFPKYFEQWGYPRVHGERLTLWTPIGMILGAHLIHLIFYETHLFTDFFSSPNGVTGAALGSRLIQIGSGLASHGGGLGAILAVIFFARKYKVDALAYMDPAMCGATFVIPWVRVGNFFNSEIVGRATDVPWGIWFPRHECPQYAQLPTGEAQELCQQIVYRHPSQVYEAILAFVMLGIAIYLQAKWRRRLRPGAHLFILLAYYFTTRFLIEYVKEYQTLADNFPLTMGQCLSAPIVLVSLYMLFFSKKSNILEPLTEEERAKWPPLPGSGDKPAKKDEPAKASASSGDDAADEDDAAPKRKKRRKKKK
ncbi:MAG: prolipoprotein diacylglyceryl transferase [Sandaracinaceae bacterium]|nr:prolipoprotein diacylglyceryl transferase [Sandaracinaceae bacterium]